MELEYRLLGPLEARRDGKPLDLGGAKQRTLLAALLLRANRTVPTDQLIDELWDSAPPVGARDTVRTYARRLHRTLRGTGANHHRLLRGDAFGYRLSVAPNGLDLHRFDDLAGQARQALLDDRPAEASTLLRQGLELWRGNPLADVASESLRTAVTTRLTENRLAALEDRIEADLALDRTAGVIGELEELVRTYPTRERFCGQLMLALYRTGRRVDALSVYRRTQRVLAEEYGCDPGSALQRLEHAVLVSDPTLDQAPNDQVSRVRLRTARSPSQLPPDIGDFTGRADALARLLAVFDSPAPAATPVAAIAGLPGTGKSAVATHLAHRLADRFPDGQLYADLRGNGSRRKKSCDVLAQFLHAFGVDDKDMPRELEERAQLFRTNVAGHRVLVVLGNAEDEAQVRPLLPGDASCGALITSRRPLAGLESVHPEHLGCFSEEEAATFLRRVVGADRFDAEPETAREIASLCGFLPLALRVSGARIAAKKHWSLSRFAGKLAAGTRRLDELRIGDLDVRASLTSGYTALGEHDQSALRRLCTWQAPDLPSWVVPALLQTAPADCEALIERLTDGSLLEVTTHGEWTRYRVHELLRDVVLERPASDDQRDGDAAAVIRVLRTYRDMATVASISLSDRCPVGNIASRSYVDDATAGRLVRDPIGWFTAESRCLISALHQAHAMTLSDVSRDMAELFSFVRSRLSDDFTGSPGTQRTLPRAREPFRVTGGARGRTGEAIEHLPAWPPPTSTWGGGARRPAGWDESGELAGASSPEHRDRLRSGP